MLKNNIYKNQSTINQEIRRLEREKEKLAASTIQDMTIRLTAKVTQLLNGGSENPTIDELAKMALTMREIHNNQEYNLLIEKSVEKLCKDQLIKNKDARKFYESFESLAKEITAFITYKNSRKLFD